MARRHEVGLAVKTGGTMAQTWAAVQGTKVTLDHLYEALFTGLATEAGIPAPTRMNGHIASYADAATADALAARAREVLGREARRFDVGAVLEAGSRHCVSLDV